MTDTLYPCLIDVTNNNTETPSHVSPTKDGPLSSHNDSDQVPQLSSPSTASTTSSPSSSMVEVVLTSYGKRPYDNISPTPSSLDAIENKQNSSNTTTNNGESTKLTLEATEIADSLQDHLHGPPHQHINKINPLKKIVITEECPELDHGDYSKHPLVLRASKRRRIHTQPHQEQYQEQDSIITNTTAETLDSPPGCSLSILPSPSMLSESTSPTHIQTPSDEEKKDDDEDCPTLNDDSPLSTDSSKEITKAGSTPTHKTCMECKSTMTSLWRRGPTGKTTLCNACGIRYSKFRRGVLSTWKTATPSSTSSRKGRTKKPPNHDDMGSPKKIASSSPSSKKLTKDYGLRAKKVYLKAGMHSGGYHQQKLDNGTMDLSRFSFPLPIHQGTLIMEREKEFELPLDIRQDYESGRLFGWTDYSSSKKPPRYIRVLHNSYVERKVRKEDQNATCLCNLQENGHGCGEDCLNRVMFIECDPSTCPCGDQCSNQKFKKRHFVKSLKVYLTDGRGWGLCTKDSIQQGTLITEYRGEIISDKTCQERIRTVYKHQKNFYFLDYHKGEVIDACTKGSEARFINHGCDPNCHIEKWSRGGEYHLGVFASKDIPAGSELFYDYNFSLFDTEAIGQECRCGSANCRGFLGKRHGQGRK